jgi:hypothetical protein
VPAISQKTLEVFCSYAHEDEKLRKELDIWLAPLRYDKLISVWTDREISPGAEWSQEISKHLTSADIILLLVSKYFLASSYCYTIELDKALERHEAGKARVIPIILSPVDLRSLSFSKLQSLPTDGKPITKWPESHRDDAFLEIQKGIRKAIGELVQLNKQQKNTSILALLNVLVKHGQGIKLDALKKELGLSDEDFDEAEAQLITLDYLRAGPTTRHITETGKNFWRENQYIIRARLNLDE